MHRAIALLAIVVLFMGTHAVRASEYVVANDAIPADEVIRIDRPSVLDQPGATYLLTCDVTAPRTAFMIKGDGITLDLGGHIVTYGTEVGVDYCHGVFLRPGGGEETFAGVPKDGFGGGNHFTVKNGRVVQGKQPVAPQGSITYQNGRIIKEEGDHPRPGRYCHAVYIRGCDGFLVDGLTTEVNSRDSNNIHVLYCKLGAQTVSDRVKIRADADITPKAVVTGPKKAKVGTIVQLDGSHSKDPRRFPAEVIRYQWRQTGGPDVNLSSTEWMSPIFFPEQPGIYTFELTVSSPIADSKPISFTVEVTVS